LNSIKSEEILLHLIALSQLEGIGPVTAKKLVAFCGGPRHVFNEKEKHLATIPGVGGITAASVKKSKQAFLRAEEEMRHIQKLNISVVTYLDENYPRRLKYCDDGPLVLFTRGEMRLNHSRFLALVGTRKPTDYGKKICEEIIAALAPYDIVVVSGMAYGIDITAHQLCLEHGIETIGVLAQGLDSLYPPLHAPVANKMIKQGGLISEFMTGTGPDQQNFPKRNRIVAGMCDATLVIETGIKGGSMITAGLANDYSRDVFAIPGKVGDEKTRGCNFLIKTQRAQLIENAQDILRIMGWEETVKKNNSVQAQIFPDLGNEELSIYKTLKQKGKIMIDHLALETNLPVSQVGVYLLNLEFKGIVRSLPGKMYELN
jgi:DNA processing protein